MVVSVDDQSNSTEIEIVRAFEVIVIDAGIPYTVEVASGTVGDAVAKAGLALPGPNDIVNIAMSEAVYPYMTVTIDRVEYVQTSEIKPISFKTVKVETASMLKGETRITTKGEYGEMLVVSQTMYINGQQMSTSVVSETVTKNAVNEIVEVGTGTTTTAPATTSVASAVTTKATFAQSGPNQFVDASGRTVSYVRSLTGKATAYTANPGASTATGRPVEMGVVAVDPDVIPYGTNLYIASADGKYVYGYALAADTGGAVRSGNVLVDLFYSTESQCRAFGRRDVVVYVLD